jgi:hypothetical protein
LIWTILEGVEKLCTVKTYLLGCPRPEYIPDIRGKEVVLVDIPQTQTVCYSLTNTWLFDGDVGNGSREEAAAPTSTFRVCRK